MSKQKEKYTPVLNRYLLEGAFAECMSQVLMSLDQCRLHDKTDMDIHQHVRALWGITMEESGVPVLLTDGRHEATLVKKHAQYMRRLKTMRAIISSLDPNSHEDSAKILRAITQWLQDAHLILHEDTPKDVREYLTDKDMDKIPEQAKEVEGVQ